MPINGEIITLGKFWQKQEGYPPCVAGGKILGKGKQEGYPPLSMINEPLISCVCLTMRGREGLLQQAIECFYRQTWPNRDMLIVADADCSEAILEVLRTTYDRFQPTGLRHGRIGYLLCSYTVGHKRNYGCEQSYGEYIAVWDDDDYYAPQRLAVQLETLRRTGKAVTAFRQVPFVMPNGEWYLHPPGPTAEVSGLGVGSSLFFRRDWWEKHPFRNTSLGEDADFARVAHNAGELVLTPETDLMYVRRHNGNTWKVDPAAAGWQRIEQPEFVVEIDGRSI